jgi:hypothetical protein
MDVRVYRVLKAQGRGLAQGSGFRVLGLRV